MMAELGALTAIESRPPAITEGITTCGPPFINRREIAVMPASFASRSSVCAEPDPAAPIATFFPTISSN